MKVYVRGYRGNSFFSKAIRWITRGSYTHVSLVFVNGYHTVEVEALEGRGVIKHFPNTAELYDFDEYVAPLDWEQAENTYLYAMELVGAEYDRKGVIGFLLHHKKHSMDKWFCAEYVAYVLYKAGYPLSRREPYREHPSSVMESFRLLAPVEQTGGA